ncbi:hypothetical protein [Paraburkholderia youngii]|uniref:hypothetical protein n=1 Tax=Paraburkholderia youngii TaxID=2782701 RepID=UPI003D1C8B86
MPTFFAAAKKVGAAPHRGNANRPTSQQAKANTAKNTTRALDPHPSPRKKTHGNYDNRNTVDDAQHWQRISPLVHVRRTRIVGLAVSIRFVKVDHVERDDSNGNGK